MTETLFLDFAQVCSKIEETSGSIEITDLVADFFKRLDDEELSIVPHLIMGKVFPEWSPYELGTGPSLLFDAISLAYGVSKDEIENVLRSTGDIGKTLETLSKRRTQQTLFAEELTIKKVHASFLEIAKKGGKGSQKMKVKLLAELLLQASPLEARYLARLVLEELRIGVGEGIVRDAIAKAFNVDVDLVERGLMLTNDPGVVATTAKTRGEDGLRSIELLPGRPVKMMLAQVASGIEDALSQISDPAVEWKFDGTRVQIHKEKDMVEIYSRKLENVTKSIPEIVSVVKNKLKGDSFILDGEVIAIDEAGKPRPFQDILRRFRRKYRIEEMQSLIPLHLHLFDILYLDGRTLIDLPLRERRKILEGIATSDDAPIAEHHLVREVDVIERIYHEALDAGHEGIMVKNRDSLYTPGKRGKNWLKIKPLMETLDLVVIGGEWGEGRRANLIGSYTLACRDPDTDKLLSIGRVGTGLTDEKLLEFTDLFSDLIVREDGREIEFKPEIIFEIAFEEIQKSPKYESGYALRFPRLIRLREDKSVEDADTLERVEKLYKERFEG
ncbi:MAG TPA: ATP-dependent DNA ligase [Candidatus Syntrophoarchaeum butanivorans]|uniref:DNA ligase n=2 Tax=Candidatus Syntropharchaeum butanivorans TaxID=1839936 RepID=A0A1F2P2W3_9EURY|nr:MAG: DNA ligase I, ATP-dependent (dnl1) [Candidatus Syntrophoarchaeum butanivorans]RJS72770.1 MAG: ATP-dependent DNA ligase [Candidatus Syntrophoarchaeum sp. WYZ-LMO15]HEC57455.1 ATP-dependent DNA ligase [Candidatus Syntrophoarchaeum butanivorans]